jgi:hypothetical protein
MWKYFFIISVLSSGGAKRVLTEMANFRSQHEWDITIAACCGPELADFYHLHVHKTGHIYLSLSKPHKYNSLPHLTGLTLSMTLSTVMQSH